MPWTFYPPSGSAVSTGPSTPAVPSAGWKGRTRMPHQIKTLTVLGTGVLGSQIAYQAAFHGFAVTAYDVDGDALEKARARFARLVGIYRAANVGGAGESKAEAALENLRLTANLDAAVDFARNSGLEPIESRKEKAGYVLNSLLVPLLNAAAGLLLQGVASPETIDKTWRIATGAPSGPFQIYDVVGLGTAYNIAASSPDPGSQAFARYLKDNYIDQGKLGVETGEGFYTY